MKNNIHFSKMMWIPYIWMIISGSRYLSMWISLEVPRFSAYENLEGSPLDRSVFLVLIVIGLIGIVRRRLNLIELFQKNSWMCWFLFFGLLSIFWSDYPIVSFKRWIKTIGVLIMALVILTEEYPYLSLGAILRRIAYLLLPLSVLYIKFYPHLGKRYHMGLPMFSGVCNDKNALGQLCLLTGIYFCWNLFYSQSEGRNSENHLHFSIYLIFFPMIVWLLFMANSATSHACLLVSIVIMLLGKVPAINKKPNRIITVLAACITIYVTLDLFIDVYGTLISMLGRRPDLTTRVPIWNDLLSMNEQPLIGYGWDIFFVDKRLETIITNWSVRNAHNGYLETYLNLGLIGLFFLIGWIQLALRNISRFLDNNYPASLLRLCFLVVILFYNWTESSFFGISNIFLLMIFSTITPPTKFAIIRPDSVP